MSRSTTRSSGALRCGRRPYTRQSASRASTQQTRRAPAAARLSSFEPRGDLDWRVACAHARSQRPSLHAARSPHERRPRYTVNVCRRTTSRPPHTSCRPLYTGPSHLQNASSAAPAAMATTVETRRSAGTRESLIAPSFLTIQTRNRKTRLKRSTLKMSESRN